MSRSPHVFRRSGPPGIHPPTRALHRDPGAATVPAPGDDRLPFRGRQPPPGRGSPEGSATTDPARQRMDTL